MKDRYVVEKDVYPWASHFRAVLRAFSILESMPGGHIIASALFLTGALNKIIH